MTVAAGWSDSLEADVGCSDKLQYFATHRYIARGHHVPLSAGSMESIGSNYCSYCKTFRGGARRV